MSKMVTLLRGRGMQIWAVLIAVFLWFQVHGQGEGSLSMDVALQVRGLPQDMIVINDLPDTVKVTFKGLQAKLTELEPKQLFVPVDASGISEPGVVERAVDPSGVKLPVGLSIEKIQPDRLQLQVDRIVRKSVKVRVNLDLPEKWDAIDVTSTPAFVVLTGPEVWLDALSELDTLAVQPELKNGAFSVQVGVASPAGKGIRLADQKVLVTIQGVLQSLPDVQAQPSMMNDAGEMKEAGGAR